MDAGTRPQTTGLGRAVWHELPASVRGGGLIDPCQLSTIDVGPSPGTPSGLILFISRLRQRRPTPSTSLSNAFSNAVNINFAPVNINFCRRQRLQQRRPPCVISTGHCFQIFRTAGPRPSPFFESRRRGHCFQIFAETGRRRFDFFFTTTSSRFCSPVWVGYLTFGLSTHPPRRSACRDSFKNSLFLYLYV